MVTKFHCGSNKSSTINTVSEELEMSLDTLMMQTFIQDQL